MDKLIDGILLFLLIPVIVAMVLIFGAARIVRIWNMPAWQRPSSIAPNDRNRAF